MRLDILIYAHDGRGLGHVSRSIAIGMALRRLYPKYKILFISGSVFTGELIGRVPLDWLKLPAYKTEVIAGQSKGVAGNSEFTDEELGELRSRDLAHVVQEYKPRLVLVDHTPQGKHRELLQALKTASPDCQWVLGVRGVVGDVKQAKIDATRTIFQNYYCDLLWYGDSEVLGGEHCQLLREQYGVVPFECGYVSRLGECFGYSRQVPEEHKWAGVVSVPWLGEKSFIFLECLSGALREIPSEYGSWCLFVDTQNESSKGVISELFSGLKNCCLKEPGKSYSTALMNARSVVIYGGYNSLVDVLFAEIPTLVILREMKDKEQQTHVHCLQEKLGGTLVSISEGESTVLSIRSLLLDNLNKANSAINGVAVNGASHAAKHLASKLH